jgi:hypothetical protein
MSSGTVETQFSLSKCLFKHGLNSLNAKQDLTACLPFMFSLAEIILHINEMFILKTKESWVITVMIIDQKRLDH